MAADTPEFTTRSEAIAAAAEVLARARARRDSLTPREAAREAYVPGGPSVEEIEELIRAQREEARAAQRARAA